MAGNTQASDSQWLRVTIFEQGKPNEYISEKVFPISSKPKVIIVDGLLYAQRDYVETDTKRSYCRTESVPYGIELFIRTQPKSELRNDYAVTVMQTKHINHRKDVGSDKCPELRSFDLERNAWTQNIGVVINKPRVIEIGTSYKVVLNTFYQ